MKKKGFEVKVVNVKSKKADVYCGRGSALGNPFRMRSEADRDRVCDLYISWFEAKIKSKDPQVMGLLEKIYQIGLKNGVVSIGCYCAPKRCHLDIVNMFVRSMWLRRATQEPKAHQQQAIARKKVAVIVGDGLQEQAKKLAKISKVIPVLASKLAQVLEAQPCNASIGVFVHSSHGNLERIIRKAAEYVAPTLVIGSGTLPAGPCPGNWEIAKGWGAKFAPAHQYIPEKPIEQKGEYDPDGFYLPARIGDDPIQEPVVKWDPDLDGAELHIKDKQKFLDDTASYFLTEQQYWDMEKYCMLRVII